MKTHMHILLLLAVSTNMLIASGNSEGCPDAIFIFGALGASAGGLLGAGIGAASSKWQVIYERK